MHYTAFYDAHGCLRARNAKTGEIVDLLAELNRVAAILYEDEKDRAAIDAAHREFVATVSWPELRESLGLPDAGDGGQS